jgi:GNAT superfamily N-acetyltransferase
VAAVSQYEVRALSSETWGAFADLLERHNGGGFGGCWCTAFHNATSAERRARGGGDLRGYKEQLVREGRAHAAVVFDGEAAVGWCQYGSPEELPGITHRKEVESAGAPLPDYRLGCFFVDRRYRRQGVAAAALDGALELIAEAGGGWRPTRSTPPAGRCRRHSSTTPPAPCASGPASPTSVPKARTTASCER